MATLSHSRWINLPVTMVFNSFLLLIGVLRIPQENLNAKYTHRVLKCFNTSTNNVNVIQFDLYTSNT